MRFRGRLRAPADDGPGLPVSVILDEQDITIEAGGELVGSWSLADVSASRTSSDQFAMSFGDDQLMFEAEDILAFSYEALPHIQGRRSRSGMMTKLRTAFVGNDAPVGSIDLREDRRLEVVSIDPPTETASDRSPIHNGQCRGTRRDGLPCRSSIVLKSGFCSSHDPDAQARQTRTVPVHDPSLAHVFRQLERAIGDVRAGRMEPEAAVALAALTSAMCATIDADESIIKTPHAGTTNLRRAT
ncbi:MAG: hypothetical protein OEX97_01105 [Acidimicrobiia bacterium]|nr:hypothetical protein [Acidimicrobiia bacterium]